MNKEFIPYNEALELDFLGFNEQCLGYYHICDTKELKDTFECDYFFHEKAGNWNSNCPQIKAPLYQQAFRWFRKKYPELDFGVAKIYNGTNNYHYHINLQWEFFEGNYEEAESACLQKLIEIVKKQNTK